jgi:hypothetical protein
MHAQMNGCLSHFMNDFREYSIGDCMAEFQMTDVSAPQLIDQPQAAVHNNLAGVSLVAAAHAAANQGVLMLVLPTPTMIMPFCCARCCSLPYKTCQLTKCTAQVTCAYQDRSGSCT